MGPRAFPECARLPRHLRAPRAAGCAGPLRALPSTSRRANATGYARSGAALIHCPTSNTFIGSGLFDMAPCAAGQRVGLATDTGGGSSFSMLRTMAAAYEIGQLRGTALHPRSSTGWPRPVRRGAACRTPDRQYRPGLEADLIALDLASTPAIAQRSARASDVWEALFPTIMMGDDRARPPMSPGAAS
jgi:guanine deaminase